MLATKMEPPVVEDEDPLSAAVELLDTGVQGVVKERRGEEGRNLTLKPGYMYRESNWEIGRAAERAGVSVREFKPRDRWTAWKKKITRRARRKEKGMLGRRKVRRR